MKLEHSAEPPLTEAWPQLSEIGSIPSAFKRHIRRRTLYLVSLQFSRGITAGRALLEEGISALVQDCGVEI